jgi:hypothetical protein
MKRERRPPLLALLEPPTYVMDTSSWLNVDERHDADISWPLLIKLIQQQRLVAPAEVIEEVKVNEAAWARLQAYESALKGALTTGDQYLLLAGQIAFAHPGIAGIRSRKTKADPFVIALAKLEGFTVVTNETTRRRPNRKMPTVCAKQRVACISLATMLATEAAKTGSIHENESRV